MPLRRPTPRTLASALFVFGMTLLLSSVLFGWYTSRLSDGNGTVSETYYLTSVELSGNQSGSPYSSAATFEGVWLPATGQLYASIAVLIAAAAVTGGVAAALLLRRRPIASRRLVSVILILAVALAISVPILPLVAQPGAICSDSKYFPPPLAVVPAASYHLTHPGCSWALAIPSGSNSGYSSAGGGPPGPETSFFGTAMENPGNLTWGPSVGWFVALGGAGLIALGAFAVLRTLRSEPDLRAGSEVSRGTPTGPDHEG
jgi:hypothetical protein